MATGRFPTYESSTMKAWHKVPLSLTLGAAVVAMKLNCLIRKALEYHIDDTILWTDSAVVLQYIRNESRRFQTFAANRVAMIHDESTPQQWRHFNTGSNPTDVAPRGAKGAELKERRFLVKQPLTLPDLSGRQRIKETDRSAQRNRPWKQPLVIVFPLLILGRPK